MTNVVHYSCTSNAPRRSIREVFLVRDRSAEYRISEIAALLAVNAERLVRRIKAGEVEARPLRGEYQIAWPELASLAIEKWGLVTIASVLGERRGEALPQLVLPH